MDTIIFGAKLVVVAMVVGAVIYGGVLFIIYG
jgi:hypothetical protein